MFPVHIRLLTAIILLASSLSILQAQTFPWDNWAAGSFTYNRAVAGNTMSVVYSESGNFRNSTLANTECFGYNTTTPRVPFFYNVQTMNIADFSSGACYCSSSNAQRGLVLAANWNDQSYQWEQLDITFATPVCGPVTFNIWDINQNNFGGASGTYFTDKIDLSATDAGLADVAPANIVVGACGSNTVTSSGSVKTITGVLQGCSCRSTSVSINSGTVKTIRIRYWNGGSTISNNPTSQYVIITNIIASPPPTASINAAPLACGSNATTLTAVTNAPNPVVYQWTGPAGSTIAAPAAVSTGVAGAGTYTLTINPGGCSATATYNLVPVGTPPNVNAAPQQTITCTQTTLSVSSSTPGVSFSWSGPGIVSGGNTANPVVNAAGIYTVTVTQLSTGCVNTAQVEVLLDKTVPDAQAGPDKVLGCEVSSILLEGASSTPGATVQWSGPGILSGGSTFTPNVNAAGTYVLTVTNPSNGCSATDAVIVTAEPKVTPSFAPIPGICIDESAPLLPNISTEGISGTWNPSTVSNTSSGTYTFTPNPGQCAESISINIEVFPEPDTSPIFRD
jgi:hypothetical protein